MIYSHDRKQRLPEQRFDRQPVSGDRKRAEMQVDLTAGKLQRLMRRNAFTDVKAKVGGATVQLGDDRGQQVRSKRRRSPEANGAAELSRSALRDCLKVADLP